MSSTLSWSSSAPVRLRIGVGVAVVALHAAVVGALAFAHPDTLPIAEPETVAVRFLEIAPDVQVAEAPPAPTPPAPEPPPKPQPKPKPKPVVKPQPKPKPQPVAEPPPEPLPVSETALSAPPAPPVEAPPPPAPDPQPASGKPDASERTTAPQAPVSDQPRMLSSIQYLVKPQLEYPSTSRRMREEGKVVVRIFVTTQGRVSEATVETSSGFERLDRAAIEAVKKARFKPASENGVPISGYAVVPFTFNLDRN